MATAGFGDGTIILFTFFALAVVLSIIGFQIQRPAYVLTPALYPTLRFKLIFFRDLSAFSQGSQSL